MKITLSSFCLVLFIVSCSQKAKTTVEKFTDVGIRNTAIRTYSADSIKADSLKKIFRAAANDTIKAGESIGCMELNEKTETVIKALGTPDSSDAAMGKSLLRWFSKPTGKGIDTLRNSISVFTASNIEGKDESNKIKHIRITSPYFKTPGQIGCGSTITFIKMQYPALKKASGSYIDKRTGEEVFIYDETKEGIAFEINEATKCVAITVHLRGQKAGKTYASLFGRVKK